MKPQNEQAKKLFSNLTLVLKIAKIGKLLGLKYAGGLT
jgi:hypothetical protein